MLEERHAPNLKIAPVLGPKLAGRDPLDTGGIYYNLRINVSVRGPYLSVMSGMETALWDLAGKALDVLIYRLFSGRCQHKIAPTGRSANGDKVNVAAK